MGQILKVICHNSQCGFEETVYFGGGMMNFTTVCDVPAIDSKTNKFVVRNYCQKDTLPSHIVFYDSPKLQSDDVKQDSHQWGEVLIKPKNNYCPGCRKYSLDFVIVGCWD